MKTDGLIPMAFADKDGWPAMGTFDILNMRVNGYQFHVDLMAGNEKWTDPRVTAVFEAWKKLLPYYSDGALGLTWQEGAQQLMTDPQKAGMYFLGTFATQQATDPAIAADVDFFPFPTLGTEFDGELGIDAPDRRLHPERQGHQPRGRQEAPGLHRHGLRSRTRCLPSTRPTSVSRMTSTPAATTTSRRSRPSSSPTPRPSRSSSTATPSRRSPVRTSCIPSLQNWLGDPDQDMVGLPAEHPGRSGTPSWLTRRLASSHATSIHRDPWRPASLTPAWPPRRLRSPGWLVLPSERAPVQPVLGPGFVSAVPAPHRPPEATTGATAS